MNMNNKEKNNFVRTQILKTLLEMMKEVPFDSIVISELVSRAEVGRASFYRNYTDKTDVLRQESVRLMKEWGGEFEVEATGNNSIVLIGLLDFLKAHGEFHTLLYRAGQYSIVQNAILALFPIHEELPNIVAYLYSSLGYTVYGWVHEWIKRGMQESGTELAHMIEEAQKKEK